MKTISNLTILFVFLSFTLLQAQAPEYGNAIYYADYFQGKRTASGEIYDKYAFTCAHKVHPFGTQLKITRMDNFKSVTVKVNDRGPYNPGCIIDLSWAAADQIGLLLDGKAEVKVEVVGYSTPAGASEQTVATPQQAAKTVNAEDKKFSLPLPPRPVTFNSAFPATTPAPSTTAKDPSAAAAVPDSYNMANVPTSYNAPSAPIKSAPSSGVTRMPEGVQGYTVQVGSYSQYSNAERQAKMISQKGVDKVYVKESRKADGTVLYKILVQTFPTKTGAVNHLDQLKRKYGLAGFVINMANL